MTRKKNKKKIRLKSQYKRIKKLYCTILFVCLPSIVFFFLNIFQQNKLISTSLFRFSILYLLIMFWLAQKCIPLFYIGYNFMVGVSAPALHSYNYVIEMIDTSVYIS